MRRPSLRSLPRPLQTAIPYLVSAVVLVVVALAIRDRFGAVSATDVPWPHPAAVALAVVLFVCGNELLVRAWLELVSLGGAALPLRLGRWVWAKSQLTRYALSMAQVASRALVARRHGLRPTTGAVTTLLEVVWYSCINGAMALATVPWWLPGTGLEWAAWFAILPGAVIVLSLVSPQAFLRAALLLGRLPVLQRLRVERIRDLQVSRRATAGLTLLYVANAVLRLAGFLALFMAVGGSASDALRVTGAFALGHLIGAVAVFAPGGLGPREGVTAIALAPVIGGGPVLMLAAATRLLELVAELCHASFARWRWATYLRSHPEDAGADLPEPTAEHTGRAPVPDPEPGADVTA